MIRVKRQFVMLFLILRKNGFKKAKYLKKHNIFHSQGENCYYHPYKIPSEPHLLSFHNNVVVASNVTFETHDIICSVLDNSYNPNKNKYGYYMGTIEIFDNVFIGANSTILYNVKIGPNAIVAAGSVVVENVQEGTIVGGNPAKAIGYVDKLAEKRLKISKSMPPRNADPDIINKYFWDI